MAPPAVPSLCAVAGAVVDYYQDLGRCFPGGNALNVAVHAARRGAHSAFIGVLGSDPAGAHIGAALAAEGVDVSRVRTHPGPTPVVVVRQAPGGECECVACPTRLLPFDLEAGDAAALSGFDLVHLAATSRLAARVPLLAAHARVSYDFSGGPGRAEAALLPSVWLAALSRPGLGDAEAAGLCRRVQEQGPRLVVVTRGRAGATAAFEGALCHAPADPPPSTDTLGAGDALLAHLAVRVLCGDPLEQALAGAAAYAAGSCSSPGAFGHELPLPDRLRQQALPPGAGAQPAG